jgi:hypothetical protein
VENAAVREAMINWAAEVRHAPVTTVLSGQTTKHIPPELWGLVTTGALFHLPNPEEYRRMQAVAGPLQRVGYPEVRELELGEALLWGVWTNDPRYRGQVVRANLRPACVRAGGETRRFR